MNCVFKCTDIWRLVVPRWYALFNFCFCVCVCVQVLIHVRCICRWVFVMGARRVINKKDTKNRRGLFKVSPIVCWKKRKKTHLPLPKRLWVALSCVSMQLNARLWCCGCLFVCLVAPLIFVGLVKNYCVPHCKCTTINVTHSNWYAHFCLCVFIFTKKESEHCRHIQCASGNFK